MLSSEYNYLEIDLSELPSRGLLYDANAKVRGRFLTIRDVKLISLITEDNATKIINEIIRKCFIFENLSVDDLYLCDRQYLAFWLRANSFVKQNGYKIEIKKCKTCNTGFTSSITLDSLEINYLDRIPSPIVLPVSNDTIEIKLPKMSDLKYVDEDLDIQMMARMIKVDNPLQYIYGLNARDYIALLDYCKKFNVGFNNMLELECPHCHFSNIVKILFTDMSIFNSFSLMEILNLTTRITKYTNVQISDDMSWAELEMLQEVTNNMIKEENDEAAKQEAKAKAKAASARASHTPHVPRH
jgi:hypothetical protein